MTASAPRSPSSSLVATSTPGQASNPATQAGGPATRTRAPSVSRQWMFERATREWTTSPTIVSSTPSRLPNASRSVRASSSAWVGCAWMPSPALTTRRPVVRAARCAAPDDPWRRTSVVTPVRSSVRSVSTSDSPLTTLLPATDRSTVVAPSAFAASSKLTRVRVEAS